MLISQKKKKTKKEIAWGKQLMSSRQIRENKSKPSVAKVWSLWTSVIASTRNPIFSHTKHNARKKLQKYRAIFIFSSFPPPPPPSSGSLVVTIGESSQIHKGLLIIIVKLIESEP